MMAVDGASEVYSGAFQRWNFDPSDDEDRLITKTMLPDMRAASTPLRRWTRLGDIEKVLLQLQQVALLDDWLKLRAPRSDAVMTQGEVAQ